MTCTGKTYFAISVRFLLWLMSPDVAVRTTGCVPGGLPFVLVVVDFALLPPQALPSCSFQAEDCRQLLQRAILVDGYDIHFPAHQGLVLSPTPDLLSEAEPVFRRAHHGRQHL
jgi:hypothetical protein